MKTEDQGWRALQNHAAAQLRAGFAERVLRAARGPQSETWRELQAHAAAQLRPGFAERVLRAAREIKANVPPLFDQVALGAVTVVVCLIAVAVLHTRSARLEDERALASWEKLAAQVEGLDQG